MKIHTQNISYVFHIYYSFFLFMCLNVGVYFLMLYALGKLNCLHLLSTPSETLSSYFR